MFPEFFNRGTKYQVKLFYKRIALVNSLSTHLYNAVKYEPQSLWTQFPTQ